MDILNIQEAFAFLTIPRKEWHIEIERLAIASVQLEAFSFLHQIRYSSRPLVPGIASRVDNSLILTMIVRT
jgi:hypothetical protein